MPCLEFAGPPDDGWGQDAHTIGHEGRKGADILGYGSPTVVEFARAKSKASVRLIPVHSELIRLGFLEYVAAIGHGPLFPGVAPGNRGGRAHTFAKRFPAFRRARGVTRGGLAFHSFRKCFVRALEFAKVDRDRAALLVGHERGFTFRAYNPEGLDLAMLREVVEAVQYPGLLLAPAPAVLEI